MMEAISNPIPLHCWDIIAMDRAYFSKQMSRQRDLDALLSFQDVFGWQLDLSKLLDQPYDALVVTDAKEIIEWTNPGFTQMTGYSSRHALGKHPSFLQGPSTEESSRKKLRAGLEKHRSVSSDVINYRKNGEAYSCRVNIFPLRNSNPTPSWKRTVTPGSMNKLAPGKTTTSPVTTYGLLSTVQLVAEKIPPLTSVCADNVR